MDAVRKEREVGGVWVAGEAGCPGAFQGSINILPYRPLRTVRARSFRFRRLSNLTALIWRTRVSLDE